jgi:hypothetical protein
MARAADARRDVYVYGETAPVEASPEQKRLTKTRRLVGVALLALLCAAGAVALAPGLLKKLDTLRLTRDGGRWAIVTGRLTPAAATPTSLPVPDPIPPPTVPVAWTNLDLGAMPVDVVQDLVSGKYYYDKRFPGNFGLAISSWKKAFARAGATERDGIERLVAAAEQELAAQFGVDSSDAVVLLKQGRKDKALILFEKMRADFTDIASPQYAWASMMLARLRPK